MSDRELLALAAKAAGIENLAQPGCAVIVRSDGEGYSCTWNPLDHSRDAFELAVDLKLMVDNVGPFSEAAGFVGKGDDMRRIGCEELHEHHGGDAYAATRRAIVRAAAAIGATQEAGAASPRVPAEPTQPDDYPCTDAQGKRFDCSAGEWMYQQITEGKK